jgi:hypothetical protein
MPTLTDLETGATIGDINDDEFAFLNENRDGYMGDGSIYYINRTYLDQLLEKGKHQKLINLLLTSLDARDEMDIKSSVAPDPNNSFNWLNPVSAVFLFGLAIVFAISLLFGLSILFLKGSPSGLVAPFAITFSFLGMLLPGDIEPELHSLALLLSIICFFLSSSPYKSAIRIIANIIGALSAFVVLIFALINTLGRGLAVY